MLTPSILLKIIHLEKNLEPFIIIAFGKIGDHTIAPGKIIELELDPRPRKTDIAKELKSN